MDVSNNTGPFVETVSGVPFNIGEPPEVTIILTVQRYPYVSLMTHFLSYKGKKENRRSRE